MGIWNKIYPLFLVVFLVSCFEKRAKKVAVDTVERRTIIETVTANGKIQPEVEVKLSPEISGEIVELNVKEGQRIKEGDLLVVINPDIYQASYERLEAALNSSKSGVESSKARETQSKAQFESTKAEYARNLELKKSGTISQAEFDAVKARYEVAKAELLAAEQTISASNYNVSGARAALKEADNNLRRTKIYAPVDGKVYSLKVEKGERVVGTSQMSGTELFRIADLNSMEVSVEVNENDIVSVELGDTAIIDVDAFKNKTFKGIVTEIANSANQLALSSDQVTNFEVKIRILKSSYEKHGYEESPFRPGMSAAVEIQTEIKADVLSVPIQSVAIRRDSLENSEGKIDECVFAVVEGKSELQRVKIGIQDNYFIEIVEGVQENTSVVTAPYDLVSKKLKDGDKVEVVDREKLFKVEER